MDVTKMSSNGLKGLYLTMKNRLDSVAQNPKEEEIYQTQDADWQSLFREIVNEMERRHLF